LAALPGWRGILLAGCIGLFIGAAGFELELTSLVTLKMGLAKTQTILIDIYNAIQNWVRSLYTALYIITLGIDR
jgi:site-specific DNA-adenine methylase